MSRPPGNLARDSHLRLIVAAGHGRSAEAEVRAILDAAVAPGGRVLIGSLLAGIGREVGGVDLDLTRDRTPVEPLSFE